MPARGANPNACLTALLLQRVHARGDGSLGPLDPVHESSQVGRHDADAVVARLRRGSNAPAEEPYDRAHDRRGVGRRAGGDEEDPRQRGTEKDAIEAVKLCIEHGVDVTFNDNGDTALHAASGEALIRFLVENGARTDVENRLKQTPSTF